VPASVTLLALLVLASYPEWLINRTDSSPYGRCGRNRAFRANATSAEWARAARIRQLANGEATRTRQIPDCRATMGHRPARRNLVGAFAFLSEMIEGAAHFHSAVWCLLLPCTLALDLQAF
jgi:hypothetical protein